MTLDIESFSRVDLKKAGLYRYAEDESTDLLCVCWAFDDGPVSAWVPSADAEFMAALQDIDGERFHGPVTPEALLDAVLGRNQPEPPKIHSWNSAFERRVLAGPAGKRYGFPELEISQTRCSMARSRYCSLPGSLEDAANELNTSVKKRVEGLNAMRYLCKPRADGTRPTIVEERERFLALVPYCADDVRAERCVDDVLPEMSPKEQRVWELDQAINDRGVQVDLGALADLEHLIDEYKTQLAAKCRELTKSKTDPDGIGPTQYAQLAAWIRANGWPDLENLQADTVRRLVARPEVPANVKQVLLVYSTYGMKAVSKVSAMRKAVCKDGRIRGMFIYQAAGTGRWSAVLVQLHNMFRSVIPDPDAAIEACRARDLDWIRALYPGVDPMKVFASCMRGLLIAKEGHELVFPDFSGIESRWNAWMFGEEWKLDAYRQFDAGKGPKPYAVVYGRAFGVDPAAVTKSQMLIGKVLDLSMGYQGGVGAFRKMAKTYGLNLADLIPVWPTLSRELRAAAEEHYEDPIYAAKSTQLPPEVWKVCDALKLAWREAHPKIVKGWQALDEAACGAVANPGKIYDVAQKRLMFKVEGEFLIARLPSGRKMRYFKPRIAAGGEILSNQKRANAGDLLYEGVDTETRKWGLTSTYGGKNCENETQGGCRDLLADAMLDFAAEALPIVMHVHDEPVLEVPIGTLTDERVARIMCKPKAWAEGFPLAIEGHRGKRYRK